MSRLIHQPQRQGCIARRDAPLQRRHHQQRVLNVAGNLRLVHRQMADQALGEHPRYGGALRLTGSDRLDSLKDSRLAHRPTHLELGEGIYDIDRLQLLKVNS